MLRLKHFKPKCVTINAAELQIGSLLGDQMSATNSTPPGRSTPSQSQLLQTTHPQNFNAAPQHPAKTDEIEILESAGGEELPNDKVSIHLDRYILDYISVVVRSR